MAVGRALEGCGDKRGRKQGMREGDAGEAQSRRSCWGDSVCFARDIS